MSNMSISHNLAVVSGVESMAKNEPGIYDEDYFERGVQTSKSGYQNYGWLPELTLKMAHHLIQSLPISPGQSVLDFGCAKGFLVKAFRILDVEAYGIDVSGYAIDHVDPQARGLCTLVSGVNDPKCFARDYDWMVSKDVFEHLSEEELKSMLNAASKRIKRIFAALPLGKDDESGFVVPEYDRDITHVTIKPLEWWMSLFENNGWNVERVSHSQRGVKDNWTAAWPRGNAFFVLSRK